MSIKRAAFIFAICAAALAPLFHGTPAHAQNQTFVSGLGDDANPCTLRSPCKTFAGALPKTLPGGTIMCLDSLTSDPFTIYNSVTIDCTGVIGSVTVAGGRDGITVAAPNAVVALRGLAIGGAGAGGQ